MLMKMFSLFDTKAVNFGAPFCTPRRELAIRAVTEMLRSGNDSPMVRFPEDFVLFEVGEFNDTTGVCEALPLQSLGPISQWKGDGHGEG